MAAPTLSASSQQTPTVTYRPVGVDYSEGRDSDVGRSMSPIMGHRRFCSRVQALSQYFSQSAFAECRDGTRLKLMRKELLHILHSTGFSRAEQFNSGIGILLWATETENQYQVQYFLSRNERVACHRVQGCYREGKLTCPSLSLSMPSKGSLLFQFYFIHPAKPFSSTNQTLPLSSPKPNHWNRKPLNYQTSMNARFQVWQRFAQTTASVAIYLATSFANANLDTNKQARASRH